MLMVNKEGILVGKQKKIELGPIVIYIRSTSISISISYTFIIDIGYFYGTGEGPDSISFFRFDILTIDSYMIKSGLEIGKVLFTLAYLRKPNEDKPICPYCGGSGELIVDPKEPWEK